MNVHLNIYIRKNGEVYRNELFTGKFTEKEIAEHPEFINRFLYGEDNIDGNEDMVLIWYTVSLEDKEREELAERKKNNP